MPAQVIGKMSLKSKYCVQKPIAVRSFTIKCHTGGLDLTSTTIIPSANVTFAAYSVAFVLCLKGGTAMVHLKSNGYGSVM